MSGYLSLTQSQAQTSLRRFLLGLLPSGVEVVAGQDNKVPEPKTTDYLVMWPIQRVRLATNIDDYVDVKFTAFILGDAMSVSAVAYGTLFVGSQVFGIGVAPNTIITALGTGTGGVGIYTISVPQTVTTETMACGSVNMLAETDLVMQVDVHGPASSDNCQIVSTAFRDSYASEQFAAIGYDVWPLYADDPRQIPFINESEQYETRWCIDLHLQVNPILRLPQQFFEVIEITLIEADIFTGPTPPPGTTGQLDFSRPSDSGLLNTGMI